SSKYMFNCENSGIKDEYEFLGYAYNDVIDKNKNMETIIQNAKPIIKEKLFTNLIMGKIDNPQEICEKLDFLNINFSLTNFIVVVMQIDGYSEFRNKFNEKDRNLYKIKLTNMVEKIISNRQKGICVEIESDKVAAIINFTDNTTLMQAKEELLVIAANIKDEVEKHFPFTITLGVGRMYKDIINIKLSYNEAVNALKYKLYQGKNEIIDIDDIEPQSKELYYYDSEKEKLLINNLKVGQQREVEILIDELFQEILDNRNVSYTYVQQVFIRIISSIVELIINLGMTVDEVFGSGYNLYEQLSGKETIEDIKIWLSEICHITVNTINKVNLTKSQKNAEKILEYVNENLSRDISINDIADWIGFSTAYVSKIFKENIGKNYIDYLNGSRIEKAKQLLKNTQLPVKEVGFRVGFNNIQTFMRTFKKYEGITPGQYRDKT
ncbi:MAG: two-component system, response regulator YesN, partial [Petroclostridium sp.]|nr:two-component system, response regulator YesN [Petroclostridium sp.]